MEALFSIIIMISSVLLVFVVFIQNPKGGGLSSDFGSAQQLGGVQKTNDFIDKATWSLAGIVAVLSIVLTLRMKSPETVVVDPAQTEQGQTQEGQPAGQQKPAQKPAK